MQDIESWIADNRDKIRDIVKAEALLDYGSIELHYRAGHYIGIDVKQRIRNVGIDKTEINTDTYTK